MANVVNEHHKLKFLNQSQRLNICPEGKRGIYTCTTARKRQEQKPL